MISRGEIPAPTVMPLDRAEWSSQLNLSNFINTYYQYRDLQSCGGGRRLLIVGSGQGLDTAVLRWRGYEVTRLDIDETFQPEVIGSVHDMHMFSDGAFDVVIASHVLEHFAAAYLDDALREIARVGRHALIYLPVAGRHGMLKFVVGLRNLEASLVWDIYSYLHKPDGRTPAFCSRQHFWELGRRGYRLRDIRARLRGHFEIISDYRNRDWLPSYNFVLRSKFTPGIAPADIE